MTKEKLGDKLRKYLPWNHGLVIEVEALEQHLAEAEKKSEKWDAAIMGIRILNGFPDYESITRFMERIVEIINREEDK